MAASWVGSYALSEAGSGSDAFALQTRDQDEGDFFLVTGRKPWITNAAESELFIVFATVDPEAGPARGPAARGGPPARLNSPSGPARGCLA